MDKIINLTIGTLVGIFFSIGLLLVVMITIMIISPIVFYATIKETLKFLTNK